MQGIRMDNDKRLIMQNPNMDNEKRMIIQSAQETLAKKDKEIHDLRGIIDDLRRKQHQMSRTIASQADTLAKQAETIAYFTNETSSISNTSIPDKFSNDSIEFKDALGRMNSQISSSSQRVEFPNIQGSSNSPPSDDGLTVVGYRSGPRPNINTTGSQNGQTNQQNTFQQNKETAPRPNETNDTFRNAANTKFPMQSNATNTENNQTSVAKHLEKNYRSPEVNNNNVSNAPIRRGPLFNNQTPNEDAIRNLTSKKN